MPAILSAGFTAFTIGLFVWLRPLRRSLVVFSGLFLVVLAWWFAQTPDNNRSWQPNVARLPSVTIDGDLVTINQLSETPSWYNALTHNCTTSIWDHFQRVSAGRTFDWRILANGWIDEMAYSRGCIDTSLPFSELRRRSAITAKAQALPAGMNFSEWIRRDLPGGHDPLPR